MRNRFCKCLQTHFVGDPAEEGVGEFVEEDGDFFFAVCNVGEFMVGFFEVDLEDGFPEGDEFGDVDVTVVNGAGGFEGVNEFNGIDLGSGPVRGLERQDDGFRAG